MTEENNKTMKWLRATAILEGISYLMIFFVSMPLKYLAEILWPNQIIGIIHGILFILYIYLVFNAKSIKKWNNKQLFLALIASIIPFGTFVADVKMFQDED